jgi:hypothetical protein
MFAVSLTQLQCTSLCIILRYTQNDWKKADYALEIKAYIKSRSFLNGIIPVDIHREIYTLISYDVKFLHASNFYTPFENGTYTVLWYGDVRRSGSPSVTLFLIMTVSIHFLSDD